MTRREKLHHLMARRAEAQKQELARSARDHQGRAAALSATGHRIKDAMDDTAQNAEDTLTLSRLAIQMNLARRLAHEATRCRMEAEAATAQANVLLSQALTLAQRKQRLTERAEDLAREEGFARQERETIQEMAPRKK